MWRRLAWLLLKVSPLLLVAACGQSDLSSAPTVAFTPTPGALSIATSTPADTPVSAQTHTPGTPTLVPDATNQPIATPEAGSTPPAAATGVAAPSTAPVLSLTPQPKVTPRQPQAETPSTAPTTTPSPVPVPVNETGFPLSLPAGFRISLFTQGPIGPLRFMAFSPDGILFVSMPSRSGLYSGNRSGGAVFALPDRDGDGVVDEVLTALSGLGNLPL